MEDSDARDFQAWLMTFEYEAIRASHRKAWPDEDMHADAWTPVRPLKSDQALGQLISEIEIPSNWSVSFISNDQHVLFRSKTSDSFVSVLQLISGLKTLFYIQQYKGPETEDNVREQVLEPFSKFEIDQLKDAILHFLG